MIEYSALSQPNKKPAAVYINKFINIKSWPTDITLFTFAITIESISVPSKDALFLKINPTPKPKSIPPKTVASNKSSVTGLNPIVKFVVTDNKAVAINVFNTNFFP